MLTRRDRRRIAPDTVPEAVRAEAAGRAGDLAFDLRVLQKHRHGWRELFTVYGLASAAYGSTIAVAIASSLGGKELLPAIWKFLQGLAGHVSS